MEKEGDNNKIDREKDRQANKHPGKCWSSHIIPQEVKDSES